MKQTQNKQVARSNAAFTLIELLVVIAIIAILAGLLLPTLTSVFKSADKNKAKAEISSIATAIKAYLSEYGSLPVDDGRQGNEDSVNDGTNITGTESEGVIERLIGDNARKISFLESTSGTGVFLDPWGQQYAMLLDTDYDSLLVLDNNDLRLQVIVYSLGDGTSGPIYSHEE